MHSQDSRLDAPQSGTDVVPFDAMTACRAHWDRFHAYRRARHDEVQPDDPLPSDQEIESSCAVLQAVVDFMHGAPPPDIIWRQREGGKSEQ